jgi:hypothetical protein
MGYTSGIYSRTHNSNYSGSHAVLLIGYDDANQCFIVKNSWGADWGESGFFRIAYSELTSLTYFGEEVLAGNGVGATSSPNPPGLTITKPSHNRTATHKTSWPVSRD